MTFKLKIYNTLGVCKREKDFDSAEQRSLWFDGFKAGLDTTRTFRVYLDNEEPGIGTWNARIFA